MKPRPRNTLAESTIPPEVLSFFRHGMDAYRHEELGSDQRVAVFLVISNLKNHPDAAARLWAQHRDEILRLKNVKQFWAYEQFESKRILPSGARLSPGKRSVSERIGGGSEPSRHERRPVG